MQMFKWFFRFLTGQAFTMYVDGGGGGGGGPTTTNTNTSNIPEYARPYVETMLGSAQKELFNYEHPKEVNPYAAFVGKGGVMGELADQMQAQVDAKNAELVPTGLKGFTPFSTNMNDYVAGASPLQQKAYGSANTLGPTQQTADASNMAGYVGLKALGTSYDPMQATSQQFGSAQAGQYMSPYLEAAMSPQIAAAQRQSDIQAQQLAGKAVGQGAFGGSRQALEQAENRRNTAAQIEGIRSKGYQDAFTNAQQQFNADQARAMQAQQANIGQQQFGANLGMTGLQNALNAANQLGTLGQQQFGQQQAAIEEQNKLGSQQQALEQSKINQQIQNYANQQQWAMQQLGNMSNLLRGLPMQSTTTQSYQAAPSTASQLAGVGTALAGMAGKAAKRGGSVKDIKKRPNAGLAAGALNKAMKG